jgi:hypothetical protein
MKNKIHQEIDLVNGTISYRIAGGVGLELGRVPNRQYTTTNGPCVDDYFFLFITTKGNGWYRHHLCQRM